MSDLSAAKVGDYVAIPTEYDSWNPSRPKTTYDLHQVVKVTGKQIHTQHLKIRIEDGFIFGFYNRTAILATPEILEQHKKELAEKQRWMQATKIISKYGDRIHHNRFTTEQAEKLAALLTEIFGNE